MVCALWPVLGVAPQGDELRFYPAPAPHLHVRTRLLEGIGSDALGPPAAPLLGAIAMPRGRADGMRQRAALVSSAWSGSYGMTMAWHAIAGNP